MTLTEKQIVDGQRIDALVSQQNFRHFRNLLNRHLFGNAYKRYGKQLMMFVAREGDQHHRHHLHVIIEKPDNVDTEVFVSLVMHFWSKTRFGYHEHHYECPTTEGREIGWVNYCLKKRSKEDLASSVDWENSTCFERR
jgi:hypothetical protein